MCILLFLRFYNFIKRIVCIYIVFFKKFQPLFLQSTHEIFQAHITFNRTDVFLFTEVNKQVWNKSCLTFLHSLYKARRMSEASFSHLFIADFSFLFVSNAMNFFIHSLHRSVLKKASM